MTPALPTGPSPASFSASAAPAPAPPAAQSYPSLTGRWRTSGRVELLRIATGVTPGSYSCSGSFTVSSQDGGVFSGSFGTQGGGFNSDRFCTTAGTLTGELLTPDGSAARARLDRFSSGAAQWALPSVTPSCEFLSGDGVWTGSASGDAIRLVTKDRLRCPENVDGGMIGIPLAEFERTITLTFERW